MRYAACIECGKAKKRATANPRCLQCAPKVNPLRGSAHPGYKGRKYRECVECGKERPLSDSPRCMRCEARRRTGVNNPAYVDGYNGAIAEWSRAVKARDGWTCRGCGATDDLQAHHIQPRSARPDLVFALDNGTTLCRACHNRAEPRRLCGRPDAGGGPRLPAGLPALHGVEVRADSEAAVGVDDVRTLELGDAHRGGGERMVAAVARASRGPDD